MNMIAWYSCQLVWQEMKRSKPMGDLSLNALNNIEWWKKIIPFLIILRNNLLPSISMKAEKKMEQSSFPSTTKIEGVWISWQEKAKRKQLILIMTLRKSTIID